MKKYYEEHNYIEEMAMEQIVDWEKLEERQKSSGEMIFGYVVGKINSDEELEADLTLPELQFRKLIKKEEFTTQYLEDIELKENEFLGIIYPEIFSKRLDKDVYYISLYLNLREMEIGNWYFFK